MTIEFHQGPGTPGYIHYGGEGGMAKSRDHSQEFLQQVESQIRPQLIRGVPDCNKHPESMLETHYQTSQMIGFPRPTPLSGPQWQLFLQPLAVDLVALP